MRYTLLLALFSLTLLAGCQKGLESTPPTSTQSLSFDMSGVAGPVIENTQVYVLDGDGPSENRYYYKVHNIGREDDRLTMSIEEGLWNLLLVCADPNTQVDMTSPVRDQPLSDQQMVQFKQWDKSEPNLAKIPEVRISRIDGVHIDPNQPQSAEGTLTRAAAMIKIVVADVAGLTESGNHKIYLEEVPNTLSWSGSLWPSKDNPEVGAPIDIPLLFHKHPPTGATQQRYYSDTLTFIVPAHVSPHPEGTKEYLGDTTKHKLRIRLRLQQVTYIIHEAELNIVPKANKIIEASLYIKSDLRVETTIKDWIDREINGDISGASIQVSRSYIDMASKDTVMIKSTLPVTLDGAAPWLTIRRLGDSDQWELTADTRSFWNDPEVTRNGRTCTVGITAGKLRKNIKVTQRPDEIVKFACSPSRILFTPKAEERRINFLFAASPFPKYPSPWHISHFDDTQVSITGATSGPSVTGPDNFTKVKPKEGAYGNSMLYVCNDRTLDTTGVQICNLYLDAPESIHIGNPVNREDTTVYNNEIKAMGGSGRFIVKTKPNWITQTSVLSDGRLQIKALRDPNEEARRGTLVIAHADDPNYTVNVTVVQNVLVRIPEFDYLLLQLHWGENEDMDIGVEFVDNEWNRDKLPVGFNMGNHWGGAVSGSGFAGRWVTTDTGKKLLEWGGDGASTNPTETVLLFAKDVNALDHLPRHIKMDVYATWFYAGVAPRATGFSIHAYAGGTVGGSRPTINIEGGTVVYSQQFSTMITTEGGVYTYDTGGYTPVGRVTYDRVKHTATVDMKTGSRSGAPIPYLR